MKAKFFFSIITFILIGLATDAQLPPVFGPEYKGIAQKDELTRVFISPCG